MKFHLNENNNVILYFSLLVYPTGFQVESVEIPEKSKGHPLVKELSQFSSPEEYINHFLSTRSIQRKYKRGKELDKYVCDRLQLDAADFGRMDAFQGIIGLFDHFRTDSDDYWAAPVSPEVLYFGEMDCRFTRLYFLTLP